MILCLNQDTLRTTPTDEFLRIAKRSGFDAVEFTMDKIEVLVGKGLVADTRRLLQEQKITTASINGPENFNLIPKRAFSELLERTGKIVDAAKEFDCDLLIPVPSASKGGVDEATVISETAEALSELADYCGNNMRLGLEFLGMRNCSVNTLDTASKIVERVGRPNVGLVLDAFHMHVSGSRFADISKLEKGRVFLAHVDDSEPGDTSKLTDENRLYPGEGVIDLSAFASALRHVGYDGFLSLELLRPAYWKEDADTVARKSRESLRRVFGL